MTVIDPESATMLKKLSEIFVSSVKAEVNLII